MSISQNGKTILSDQELLAKLVGFDTTSALENPKAVHFIAQYLEDHGVGIELIPGPTSGKPTLLALIGELKENRAGLLLSGHLDCVPADPSEWDTDPWSLTEKNGFLYGRGTVDMKGFDALAINKLASVDVNSLEAPLGVILTHDEEVGSWGASSFAENYEGVSLPKSCVVGEPSERNVVHQHKGSGKFYITILGKSGHTGNPANGDNAITRATMVLKNLDVLRVKMENECFDNLEHFDLCFPVLSVTTINGGRALNVIPDKVVIGGGIRILPGQSIEDVVNRIEEEIKSKDNNNINFELISFNPQLETNSKSQIVETVLMLSKSEYPLGVSYSTDAGFLAQLGLECVIWGPGSIARAHQPNEYIKVEEMVQGRRDFVSLERAYL